MWGGGLAGKLEMVTGVVVPGLMRPRGIASGIIGPTQH